MVIFDLGGVLLREAESNLHKAHSKNIQKALAGNVPQMRIFNRTFEFAAIFCGSECKNSWILGTVSGDEIVTKIKENIDKPEYDSFFKNQYERDLIKHGIEFVLLPEQLVELTEIIDEGLAFIETCKKNDIELAIISNWDPASFVLAQNKFNQLFAFFDEKNIVIPQMVGKTKPSPEIYAFTVQRSHSNLKDCFFVDDSPTNVKGAQEYGIKSVVHRNWQETEQALISLGLKLQD